MPTTLTLNAALLAAIDDLSLLAESCIRSDATLLTRISPLRLSSCEKQWDAMDRARI